MGERGTNSSAEGLVAIGDSRAGEDPLSGTIFPSKPLARIGVPRGQQSARRPELGSSPSRRIPAQISSAPRYIGTSVQVIKEVVRTVPSCPAARADVPQLPAHRGPVAHLSL
jgi:hypothetical protein